MDIPSLHISKPKPDSRESSLIDMAERFQAASLVPSPSYPNSVAWSDENLVVVASGHLVTILNPDMPFGPRGLITIPVSKPFPIGVIERKDLLSGGLLPISLSRDLCPCVRSVSWSPVGFAPNSGCLLAVCTTEGRVKLYSFPFCEFSAEWVEVMDISEMLYTYLANVSFWELDVCSSAFSDGQESQHGRKHRRDDLPISELRKDSKLIRHNESSLMYYSELKSVPSYICVYLQLFDYMLHSFVLALSLLSEMLK